MSETFLPLGAEEREDLTGLEAPPLGSSHWLRSGHLHKANRADSGWVRAGKVAQVSLIQPKPLRLCA